MPSPTPILNSAHINKQTTFHYQQPRHQTEIQQLLTRYNDSKLLRLQYDAKPEIVGNYRVVFVFDKDTGRLLGARITVKTMRRRIKREVFYVAKSECLRPSRNFPRYLARFLRRFGFCVEL